jgi:hypothetical protein
MYLNLAEMYIKCNPIVGSCNILLLVMYMSEVSRTLFACNIVIL